MACSNNANSPKTFGGFIQACKENALSTELRTTPITVKALNKEEAIGVAIKYCKERFPLVENWHSHIADVVEIDE